MRKIIFIFLIPLLCRCGKKENSAQLIPVYDTITENDWDHSRLMVIDNANSSKEGYYNYCSIYKDKNIYSISISISTRWATPPFAISILGTSLTDTGMYIVNSGGSFFQNTPPKSQPSRGKNGYIHVSKHSKDTVFGNYFLNVTSFDDTNQISFSVNGLIRFYK